MEKPNGGSIELTISQIKDKKKSFEEIVKIDKRFNSYQFTIQLMEYDGLTVSQKMELANNMRHPDVWKAFVVQHVKQLTYEEITRLFNISEEISLLLLENPSISSYQLGDLFSISTWYAVKKRIREKLLKGE